MLYKFSFLKNTNNRPYHHAAPKTKIYPSKAWDSSLASLDLFSVKRYIPPNAPIVDHIDIKVIASPKKIAATTVQNNGFKQNINIPLLTGMYIRPFVIQTFRLTPTISLPTNTDDTFVGKLNIFMSFLDIFPAI